MEKNTPQQNPINRVRNSVPPLVWAYFNNVLSEKIGEVALTQSEKNSFRQTVVRYSIYAAAKSNMKTINIYLRRIIEEVWPVSETFFEGSPEQALLAADETAAAMIKKFETLLAKQKAALAS